MKLCDWCGKPGQPYRYKGIDFDGLHAARGERLCSLCLNRYLDETPVFVTVVDGRPGIPDTVVNITDPDAPVIIRSPHGFTDGRDLPSARRARRKANALKVKRSP